MADINASDVKLKQSQRLDDTDFGGGQMIATEVIDGQINNLFPDISRLDRVYGRVSMRKAFLNVETANRATYYGSNVVITEQALDPKVSVCFFTTQDWFDKRASAKSRVESYLVKGPTYPAMFWADHYLGSLQINLVTELDQTPPDIGEVIVLIANKDLAGNPITEVEQYVRITDVSTEIRIFTEMVGSTPVLFQKQVIYVEIGSRLLFDIPGLDPSRSSRYNNNPGKVVNTVVADASTYYSVAKLQENITAPAFSLRVDSIFAPIVPSAASETGVVDVPVGYAKELSMGVYDGLTVNRSFSMQFAPNAQVYMGEAVKPGTWSCTGTYELSADVPGNVYYLGSAVGSIEWNSGTITFGADVPVNTTNVHTFTYDPATPSARVMETSGIVITEATRGRAYTFRCLPLPQPGSVRIDYLSSGKWYTLADTGEGRCEGTDPSLGTATVNFTTGSVNIGLGEAMPDVGSMLLVYWATADDFYLIENESNPWFWDFTLNDTGIALMTLVIAWDGGSYSVKDTNGDGTLDYYVGVTLTTPNIGTLNYETGQVTVEGIPITPAVSTVYNISYNCGPPTVETFAGKTFDAANRYDISLSNVGAILPNTLRVLIQLSSQQQILGYLRWSNTFRVDRGGVLSASYPDDGVGGLKENAPNTAPDWSAATVTYTAGAGSVSFSPNINYDRSLEQWGWSEGATRPSAVAGIGGTGIGPVGAPRYTYQSASLHTASPYVSPVGGNTVVVSYQEVGGGNSESYTQTLELKYKIDPDDNGYDIVSGSLKGSLNGVQVIDVLGDIRKVSGGTSPAPGEKVGIIDYETNTIVITTETMDFTSGTTNVPFIVAQAQGVTALYPITEAMFRTPGAPVRVESLTLYAEDTEGNVITASSTSAGDITGTYVKGGINYDTGVAHVAFGRWVTNDAGAQAQDWWLAEQVEATDVWEPWPVDSNSILINCVVTSYLPLDPDLLGLNPVRLPLDGKVPIFRDAGIILIHDTQTALFPTPVIDAQEVFIDGARIPVEVIRLIDSTGAMVPEIDEGTPLYSVDGDLGKLTVINSAILNAWPYLPLTLVNRMEDMVLASDVQVTGHIAVVNQITHDYDTSTALVSSVLPSADLQARIENEFEQDSWTGVWSDTVIGGSPLASYDVVNYPILVTNENAVEERFACIFTNATNINIVGENLGVIYQGTMLAHIEVNNPQSPGNYFRIDAGGWGGGWSTGDVFRFNSKGANYPLWFIRTTLQGPPQESTDNYVIEIRGDSA